jgi:7-keto-8-aminopelargonate synthetase-like enzyme
VPAQDLHKQLEARISAFHGTQDTILYPSCFDANAGLFEVLLGPEDAVISDELNHASIIDGIRLCKAKRLRCARVRVCGLLLRGGGGCGSSGSSRMSDHGGCGCDV